MTAPPAESQPAIACAIIVANAKVLLVRRRVPEGELSWQFPAGAVEPGESGEQAAVRETYEEVGLRVAAAKRLGERSHPMTGRTMIYVACDVLAGQAHITDDELDAVEWCDRATLATYVPSPLFGPVQDHISAAVARPPVLGIAANIADGCLAHAAQDAKVSSW